MVMVVALILALLVAVFALQNATEVLVHFLFWRFQVSLVLVILGAAACGALVVGIISMVKQIRSSIRLQEATVINRRLERDLSDMRHRLAELKQAGEPRTPVPGPDPQVEPESSPEPDIED